MNSRLSGNLLRDLLDFGQVEQGKFQFNKSICNLQQIVENTVTVLKRKLQNKEINLSIDIKNADRDCFSKVFVDADRLGQILINLVSNAIKFSQKKAPLTIRLEVDAYQPVGGPGNEDPEDMDSFKKSFSPSRSSDQDSFRPFLANYQITVQDYGAGIPQDQLAKLFCDFGTLDVHRKMNPEGRGLGLAISKVIVDRMGGHIEVASRLGHGTTFIIVFEALCSAKKLNDAEEDVKSENSVGKRSACSNNRIVHV